MKAVITIIIILLLAISCRNDRENDENQIKSYDLAKLPPLATVKLSDLGFTDIEYIPLETSEQSVISFTDNVLIGSIPPIKIVVGEGFYLIKQFNTILKFREDGSFVTKIEAVGRGPNEYTVAHDIDINIEDRNIYLVSAW